MPKRGTGRVQQIWRQPRIATSLALGALATKDLTSNAMVNASDTMYLLSSAVLSWNWEEIAALDDGPIMFGIAAGGYTSAQIEEAIEAIGSINLDNRIAQEQSNRLVRVIGTVDSLITSFNDGKQTKTKLNWRVPIGSQPQIFGYNNGTTIIGTGSSISAVGHFNIKFL